MDAKQLQYFAAIVQKGSFNEAARACHVTQPAISAALRKLEDELGVPLLERHSRRIELTEFGRSLYKSALSVAADFQQAKESIEALRKPGHGRIRLGIDQTIAPRLIVDGTSRLLTDYPGIRVEITTGLASQFGTSILEGGLDFIIAQLPPPQSQSPELTYEPLFRESVFPVANPGHALAGSRRVSVEDLSRSQWCGLRWIRGRILWLPDFFAALGTQPPELTITGNALSIMQQLLMSTDLLGLFPQQLVADDIDSGRLTRIGPKRFSIDTTRCIIYRRNRHQSPSVQALLDMLYATTRKRRTPPAG